MRENYDVIVVGAGPAGIMASYEFVLKNPNLSVLLIDLPGTYPCIVSFSNFSLFSFVAILLPKKSGLSIVSITGIPLDPKGSLEII